MLRILSKGLIIALLVSGALYGAAWAQSDSGSGQSLGDLARANRAKQQAQQDSGTPPKVITNQDLPSGSTGVPESSEPMTEVSGVEKSNPYTDQRLSNRLQAEQRTSERWKVRIQEQENRIADLQARIDRVNAETQAAIGTVSYDTPVNRYQMIQTERLATLQQILDQQKRKLEAMQDAARRAGMGQ